MAKIKVRGLSAATKEALRERAAEAGLSLEAFARRALQRASTSEVAPPRHLLDVADQYFGSEGGVDLKLPSRSTRRSDVDAPQL